MSSLLLRNARLVDPERETVSDRLQHIRVDGTHIEAIVDGDPPPAASDTLDLDGAFVLPGLIDCHAHTCGIFQTELPGLTDIGWIFEQIDLNLRAHLAAGVTTVRDMMAPLRLILRQKRRAARPNSGFPRVLCAGPMLTVPGGYPPHVPRDPRLIRWMLGPLRLELAGAAEARAWVDRLADAGVDCIKVGYSSQTLDDRHRAMPTPPPNLLAAVCEAAHARDLPVAVHHYWSADLEALAETPIDSVEHLTMDRPVPPAVIERLATRGIATTTDLEVIAFLSRGEELLARYEREPPPVHRRALPGFRRILEDAGAGRNPHPALGLKTMQGTHVQKRANLLALKRGGVRVGAATDAGTNLPFGTLADELRHMVQAGLTPGEALRAATIDAAAVVHRPDLGRIAPAHRADLIAYTENPLVSLEHLGSPRVVVRDGVVVRG